MQINFSEIYKFLFIETSLIIETMELSIATLYFLVFLLLKEGTLSLLITEIYSLFAISWLPEVSILNALFLEESEVPYPTVNKLLVEFL